MNIAYWSSTLACTEQWIISRGSRDPTEPALLVLILLVRFHDSWHLFELFPFFIIRICKYWVWTVTSLLLFFLFRVYIHRLAVTWITNFLDGKLDTTDLENVFLLNFIILWKKTMVSSKQFCYFHSRPWLIIFRELWNSMITYDLLVIVLQTADNKVHLLVILRLLSCLLSSNVLFMMLEGCTLQVECTVIVVHNFE